MNAKSPTITAPSVPPNVTMDSAAPARIDIDALHLCITQTWDSGSSQNIHLLENGDLPVVLTRARNQGSDVPPGDTGTLVISLGVDEDHDEVHYTHRGSDVDLDELLGQAIETLIACRHAAGRLAGLNA